MFECIFFFLFSFVFFIVQVATYSDLNMMTPANLGIVFSPNVIQTPPDADVFRQFEVIYEKKMNIVFELLFFFF